MLVHWRKKCSLKTARTQKAASKNSPRWESMVEILLNNSPHNQRGPQDSPRIRKPGTSLYMTGLYRNISPTENG